MNERRKYWYTKAGRVGVQGFLSRKHRRALKELAKEADKSLQLYITRLLEAHLKSKGKF